MLSLAERRENAREHADILADLLAAPAAKGQAQRIYRARVWMQMTPADLIVDATHEYLVLTLVQSLTQQRIVVYVTRPFTNALAASATTKLELSGAYSVDEIVAFLMLDMVPASQFDWHDETGSEIVVAHSARIGGI